jgi:predicted Zn-ribbon and HTH transcriptional regulator
VVVLNESVTLPQFTCKRCGKTWAPRKPQLPAQCPGCKSAYWDQARVREVRRREAGQKAEGGRS